MFVDQAKILIRSGKGGNGSVSFRREPFVPEGGPDGGDGGKGGDIIFVADSNLRTLMDFKYKKKYEAESGQDGMKRNKFGKNGQDLVIKVPPGTQVIDEATGKLMKDLVHAGDSFVAAKGGKGGKGNVHFKNSVRQAPNFAEAGGFAKERSVLLNLKLIADVGLVGFPNAGKSTLLSVCTNARPKIGDYPFTTITPNLGVAEAFGTSFVMADIAGILEGAHLGVGMGFQFLKHVERTKILIHVVDASGSEGRDPLDDFEKVNRELAQYSTALAAKPQIVCANKMDMVDVDSDSYKAFERHIRARGLPFYPVSAALRDGIPELVAFTARLLAEVEASPAPEQVETFDFERDDADPGYRDVHVRKTSSGFELAGRQLEKIFNSTNFNDMGSLRYLYKYIEKSGAVEQMKGMGLDEGDTIRIKDFEFEYYDEY